MSTALDAVALQAFARGWLVRHRVQQARQRFADLCRELDAVEPSAAAPSGPSAAAPPSTAPSVRQQVSSLAAGAAVTIQLPGSAHKVASQREALLQQRRALAMERLWTIQCIKSREHYLRIRRSMEHPDQQGHEHAVLT